MRMSTAPRFATRLRLGGLPGERIDGGDDEAAVNRVARLGHRSHVAAHVISARVVISGQRVSISRVSVDGDPGVIVIGRVRIGEPDGDGAVVVRRKGNPALRSRGARVVLRLDRPLALVRIERIRRAEYDARADRSGRPLGPVTVIQAIAGVREGARAPRQVDHDVRAIVGHWVSFAGSDGDAGVAYSGPIRRGASPPAEVGFVRSRGVSAYLGREIVAITS